ncbi:MULTISPECIES: alpha/beta hydrolase [Clostridium]|uniref:alpha/beta fold hydrolase n=1 Tax=Clostridium TaxID=1485 RepID=UPI0029434637|nr:MULTISPECIES: alpha/beta hydrolase [unclassified Clostridium]
MMEHKQISSENGIVHYWIHRSKREDAKCIVFTHGVTADHTMFEKQVEFFEGKYTLILWDVPMHGLSRPYRNFSYYNTAVELHRILKEENMKKVILVGMSMGGYPSQHFADLYPNMVDGFIALDTTPLGLEYYSKSDLWWLKQVAPIAKCFTDKFLRKSMAKSISNTQYSYQKMMDILKPLSKNDIIDQMRIAYEYFPKENKNVNFQFPVLILVGENDSTGKVKVYCQNWSQKTGYPIHFIKDAKHFSNGDNPKQVNFEITRFIDERLG